MVFGGLLRNFASRKKKQKDQKEFKNQQNWRMEPFTVEVSKIN